ncbi:MAG: diaminopimelate decarboxylase [Alphaproteobacteria bacterium]|nr:diaminopimelate decarboxylase [Alphaproteobacteria bacterium]
MSAFAYRNRILHAEDVDLAQLADSVATPFYCYSAATLVERFGAFRAALPDGALIAYAVKANGNLAVLRTLAAEGAGADVVSGGELKKALAAGIAASRIVFSGVGKSAAEMALALEAGIHQFNVESEAELAVLDAVARAKGVVAPVALRINPDIDAGTHAKITTGTAASKFGIALPQAREAYARAASLAGIAIVGIDVHIGSQIATLAPFQAAFRRVVALAEDLRAQGHGIARLDLGGGLGIAYAGDAAVPNVDEYAAMVRRVLEGHDFAPVFEPGRAIAAPAGLLVSRVLYVKHAPERTFLILDAGMNDLLRPALYEAHHAIVRVRATDAPARRYDVVGPICESADVFARDRELPQTEAGDLVAFLDAGAYGATMASAYNARPPAAEVLVKGERWSVVRPRLTDDDLLASDRIPDWLR